MSSLTVLGVRSLESRCRQDNVPSEGSKEASFLFVASPSSPWHSNPTCILRLRLHGAFFSVRVPSSSSSFVNLAVLFLINFFCFLAMTQGMQGLSSLMRD